MISKVLLVILTLSQAFAYDLQKFSIPLDDPIVVKAGIQGSIDLDVLRNAADEWFNTLIGVVNGLKIPDITDKDGNYFKENVFYINQAREGVTFTPDVTRNSITFRCDKLTA